MVRLLKWADVLLPNTGAPYWHNHMRCAKRRARAIRYTRGKDKKRVLYQDLVRVVQRTLGYLQEARTRMAGTEAWGLEYIAWHADVAHDVPLIEQIIDQARRRVFAGEKVPAKDKIVSLFEPHTDIIVKDQRDVYYGHKLNLPLNVIGNALERCRAKWPPMAVTLHVTISPAPANSASRT
jgi:IS5 family transposase